MAGERVGRIMGVVDGFGIRDDEFFHGLLADDLCNVMYGSITDVELDTACRAWLKWHDAGMVFFGTAGHGWMMRR